MLSLVVGNQTISAANILLRPYPNLLRANSPISETLEADALRVVVRGTFSTSPLDWAYGTEIEVLDGTNSRGKYYLTDAARVGLNAYQLDAVSTIGLLLKQNHDGGVYTGQTAGTIIANIMGSLPYQIDANVAGEQIYGWLPNTAISNSMSSRDNLQQVLFAIGAFASKTANGVLNFSYNPQSAALAIPDSRVFWGSEGPEKRISATSVSVVEHTYYQSTLTAQEEIYNTQGVSVTNQKVIFDKPYYSLAATGLTINSSGPNFAVVTGSGSLKGKPYVHMTRELKRVLDANAPEKNVGISKATLVSSFNSLSVLNRLANYYGNAVQREFEILVDKEKPGDLVVYNNRYDERKTGYISELSETFSGLDRGQVKVVTDWVPTSPGNNYDLSIVLTKGSLSSGRWAVPTRLRGKNAQVVLFSGAQGGQGGWYGQSRGFIVGSSNNYDLGRDDYVGGPSAIQYGGAGGNGGNGGASATRMTIFDVASLANSYNVAFGNGGNGGAGGTITRDAAYNETYVDPTDGAQGGDSTFGSYGTASGSAFAGYYIDMATGDEITSPGDTGVVGGAGGTGGPSNQFTRYTDTFDYSATGKGGNGSPAGDGTAGGAGANGANGVAVTANSANYPRLPAGKYYLANGGGGGGGGGAAGGTAQAGTSSGGARRDFADYRLFYVGRNYNSDLSATYYSPVGGDGAAAVTVPDVTFGRGGRGGAGGGGGGGSGQTLGNARAAAGSYYNDFGDSIGGKGGNGGQGGKGSDGFALIYLKASDLLPSGYTALEYIEAAGANGPRIDTGVTSDVEVTIDAVSTATFTRSQIWAARAVGGGTATWFGVNKNGKWGVDFSPAASYVDIAGTTRARSKVKWTTSGVTAVVNGIDCSKAGTITLGQVTLCNDGSTQWGVTGRLYRVIMTLDGRTVWCGIPAKNSSNVAGLYDVIGNTFYPSATGTPFTAGPAA